MLTSLRKQTILVISFFIFDLFFFQAKAQTIDLGDIIVSARRTPVNSGEISENITIIGKEEIKNMPGRTLAEVLKYVPGVDIDLRTGFGQPNSVSIQGSDSRQVRIMIDGILLNSQVSEQVDPNWIPLSNVERIEIIKGSASSVWGSGLGGLINIITRDPAEAEVFEGKATVSAAEFRTRKEEIDFSGKAGDLGYYLLTSYGETGGKDARADVLEKKTFARLSYDLKDLGQINASFGYSGADVNSGIYPDGTWIGQPYQVRYGKLGWQGNIAKTEVTMEAKHSGKRLTSHTYLSETDQEPFITVRSKDSGYQLSLNTSTPLRGKDLFVAGTDLDWNTIKSNTYLSKAEKVNAQAGFFNYTLKADSADYNFGLRYDYNSEFGSELSPSLGLVCDLEDNHNTLFRTGISRAFNAPLLLWRYNANAMYNVIPNPELGAERAWVWEAGLETRPTEKSKIKLSLYRSDVSDAIAWASNGAGQQFKKNYEKFRRQGIEVQTSFSLNEQISFFASGAFNDIEDRTTGQTVKGGGKPRQSFDLGIKYKNKKGFSGSIKGYYDRWNEPASYKPNDRKMLFDAHFSQEHKQLTFFLNLYNLTNSSYWSDYYFPVPGRYFEGGVTVHW